MQEHLVRSVTFFVAGLKLLRSRVECQAKWLHFDSENTVVV